MKRLLEKAGMVFLEAFDGYTKEKARGDSGRIVIAAREQGKKAESQMDGRQEN